ncbi:hypothetical protein AZL_f00410 (plasmid) [Azospirillum sp. B510]|uniref:glycosyltransferase n=1 Tax=Azospirillum sp. (strain B510) TaxID=137722 RepID=UPI0001C4CF26|nr:glycosyltransferase [Azospirillum sp. B510]BAI76801.1 hypothetical protein AZL_f00410 [Azospirillum sp. B510]
MTVAIEKNLGVAELAALFGGSEEQVARWCAPYLDSFDFGYTELAGAERDRMLLEALKRLEPNAVSVSGKDRQPEWETGWTENLTEFVNDGYRLDSLVPKYIRPNEVVRLFGQYARPHNPHFIRDYTKTYRAWLAQRFFADASAIYEFGCGPGSHVAYFAETFPGKPVVGLDWAEASVRIMQAMADHYGWPVSGHRFDFFAPDHGIRLPEGAAVLTFGALEQVGANHGPFLDYLLASQPLRCVHVEGINELYDEEDLLDRLALRYHERRNYLSNLLTRLRELEAEGKVVIEAVHRQRFGTRFNDTFSYVVWRPVRPDERNRRDAGTAGRAAPATGKSGVGNSAAADTGPASQARLFDLKPVADLFAAVRYEDALAELGRVSNAAGGRAERGAAAGWRRRLLANLGDLDGALASAAEAVFCNPDSAEDHYRQAEILARRGRYAEAFASARAAHDRAPADLRPLAVCMEAALAAPSLRSEFLSWCARSASPRAMDSAGPVVRAASGILLPDKRAAFELADGSHPDALNVLRTAEGVSFLPAAPAEGGSLAALAAGFDHCVRVCDALTGVHPLVDRASAARYVGHRALSLVDDGQGAVMDLLTTIPMTVGQRPYTLLLDLIPAMFQPFEPYVRHAVSADRSPLYWIVRAFLESPHCLAIYSPYQEGQSLLGRFFQSPAIERKTAMVDHLTPDETRSQAITLRPSSAGGRREGGPTLLFTASAVNPSTKFYLRGGVYVLALFRELVERYPDLRLIMRTPLPDTLGLALRDLAVTHPNIRLIETKIDYASYHDLFRQSDIFLSPSTGFYMNSTLNAMRYGAVPVLTDTFGCRDMIADGRNGVLVAMPPDALVIDADRGAYSQDFRGFMRPDEPGDPALFGRLREAVVGLIENPDRRQELSHQAMDDHARGFPGRPQGRPITNILKQALASEQVLRQQEPHIVLPASWKSSVL